MRRTRPKRPARTPDQKAAYEANWAARFRHSKGRCELMLPRVCTGIASGPHHVFPQRAGLDDSFENLRASCWPCNCQVEQLGKQTARTLGLYSDTPLGDPDAGYCPVCGMTETHWAGCDLRDDKDPQQ